jgi:hypothetical protein
MVPPGPRTAQEQTLNYAFMVIDSEWSYTCYLFEGNFTPEEFQRYYTEARRYPQRPRTINAKGSVLSLTMRDPMWLHIESLPTWAMTTKRGFIAMRVLLERLNDENEDICNDDSSHQDLCLRIKEQNDIADADFQSDHQFVRPTSAWRT